MRHLVLAGGGHAHVEVLWQFARKPLAGWRVTLLTREALSPYSGMLPGVAAGIYRPEQALIDARALAARAGAEFVQDEVTGLDPRERLIRRAGGEPMGFDLLSIDTGATPDLARVPGASRFALPLKPIDALLPRLATLAGSAQPGHSLAVVGAGPAGFEMSLAFARRFRPQGTRVTLVAGASGLLPGVPEELRSRARAALDSGKVALHEGDDVAEVTAEGLLFSHAAPLGAESVIWATGAAPAGWLAKSGLTRDITGFLQVEPTLRAVDQDAVFAAGDVASLLPHPLPKAGVFAVRQGPVLARNLRAAAEGRTLEEYKPQREWLVLLSTSDGRALGTRNGLAFGGRWVWWWKDLIDRRFVARYNAA
jgi:selenide,water dikinase